MRPAFVGSGTVINDRLIEPDSLVIEPGRVRVDVRIPWYRAIPASCISDVSVRVDGDEVPRESVRCELNGRVRRLEEFAQLTDESWFTTDALTVSGDLDVDASGEHDVFVNLKLYIPYIITDHGVLMIDESLETTMTGATR
jgi:Domain of unknown function (DUF6379)